MHAGPVSEPIEDEGYLGYCWMHHFKCHSARTCYTWAAGGPISDNKVSMEWQDRAFGKKNPAGALPIFTGEPTSKFTNKGMISAEVQIGRNVVKDVGEVVQSIYRGLVGGRTSMAERRMAMAVASMQKELSDRAKAKGANAIANLNVDYELVDQSATLTLIATADAIKMRSPPKTKMTGAQYRSGVKKMLEAQSNPRKNGGHAISYSAVVLTEESREELLSSFQIPEGWSEFAHHMTITMGPLTHKKGKHDFSEEYPIGSTVELQVVGVGMDDKVMAVEVEPPADISAKISYPHITVAVNTEEGGKPFHSNKLDNSEFTPVEFTLYGEVTEVAQPDPNPTKSNPLKNPTHSKKVEKGKNLYKHMTGKEPEKIEKKKIDMGDVWYQVGEGGCWQIGYMSGKETGNANQKYTHTFNEETQDGNFPKLYATMPESGKPLLIIQGGTWKIKTDDQGVAWIYD